MRQYRQCIDMTIFVMILYRDTDSLYQHFMKPGPEVIKLFSCSNQLSMEFSMPINLILQKAANSFLLNRAEHENFSANKYENASYCWHFHIY